MGGATNWREVQTGEDWMRSQEKRMLHEERRPQIKHASDLMGPAMGPYAVRISDWNQAETEFNGLVWSEPGALNTPNGAEWWIGQVIAQQGGFGVQTAWNYRTPGTPALWVRTFSLTGGTRSFTPWQQGGGGGQVGDGTRWLTGAGAPTAGVGEVGNFYLNSTTGDFFEKVTESSWALRGSLRGPQGLQGNTGDQGPQGDQGIQGPEGDPGAPGSKWWVGTGGPAAGLGIEGDFHLDVTTGNVSLKTGPLAWTVQGSILGPVGPEGPEGPQGPDGTLIPVQATEDPGWPEGTVWWDTDEVAEAGYLWDAIEAWDPTTTYSDVSPVSVVTYEGSTYIATAASTGEVPGTGASWMKVAERGDDGTDGYVTAIYQSAEPTQMPNGEPLVGGAIWVDPDATGFQSQEAFSRLGQRTLRGGGRRIVSTGGVAWTQRFYVAGAGRNAAHASDGYFNIVMPPIGTVINKIGGAAATATVTADGSYQNTAGRYIPLAAGETLWWNPPMGSVGTTLGEFIITRWPITADYDVPETWVHVVSANIDYPVSDGCSHEWGDGREQSYWTDAALQAPWSNYGAGHAKAGWKKENGWVMWKGLVKGGSTGNPRIVWLSDYNADMSEVTAGDKNLHIVSSDTSTSRVDTDNAQMQLITGGGSAFLSLGQIRYWNG
jgi:hypothetical protein